MSRWFNLALPFVLCFSASLPAVAAEVFTETFDATMLSHWLATSASSSAYALAPGAPGQSWQMTKQAGTTTGAAEIQTRFQLRGDFTAELTLAGLGLGTGEAGMRFGETYVNPWAEIHFHGPDGGRATSYVSGGYGIGGFAASARLATLRLTRTGTELRYFVNDRLFTISAMNSAIDAPLTVFLRPYSGNGAFDPTVGQPDAHAVFLHHLTLTADALLVPEPATLPLFLGPILASAIARRRRRP